MRKRISPSTIIASLALFFSLTGAGLAAQHYLITNVNQIKPSVRHALRGERGLAGSQGARGAQGATGPQGTAGPAGAFSTADITQSYGPPVDCPSGSACPATARCPSGSRVIGGGFEDSQKVPADTSIVFDAPIGAEWVVEMSDNGDSSIGFRAVALCAS